MLSKWNTLDIFRPFDNWYSHTIDTLGTSFEAYKEDSDLYLEAAVPGLKRDELKVRVDGSVLTINGETKEDNRYKNKYSFTKQYKLPDNIDLKANELEARLNDGILQIKFNEFYKEVEPPKKKEFDIPIK